jgi:F0F1-type ATP synthase membrane subunit b/b'
MQARAETLAAARTRAQQQIAEARAAIEQDKIAAQTRLQADAATLATEIIRIVLQPVATAPAGTP